jgi:hypothetical protein
MDTRVFIGTVAGGLLAAPFAAEAQQAGKSLPDGILGNGSLTDPEGGSLWEELRRHNGHARYGYRRILARGRGDAHENR